MVLSRTSCWPRTRSASAKARLALRLRELRARLIERILERPPVDGEKKIALLHILTVGEMHFLEIAGDARAHFDRIDRDEAADIFVEIADLLLDGIGDRHGGRRRRGLLGLLSPQAASINARKSASGAENAAGGLYNHVLVINANRRHRHSNRSNQSRPKLLIAPETCPCASLSGQRLVCPRGVSTGQAFGAGPRKPANQRLPSIADRKSAVNDGARSGQNDQCSFITHHRL